MNLQHYIEKTIEAAEYGSEEGVAEEVVNMTHKRFICQNIIFDLRKTYAPEEVRKMIDSAIGRFTNLNVSFL
jgi:hypothetical protein